MMKKLIISTVALIGLVLPGCSGGTLEIGILEGTVTIGPICPVEQPDSPCPVPCEVYQARHVMIYNESGARLLKQVDIDCTGHYRIELQPGEYTVDISDVGIDHSGDVPKKIEVNSGLTIGFDIDIDTGIRF